MSASEVRPPVDVVCPDCAKVMGGVWPPGHVATMSVGVCDACRTPHAVVCSVGDWDWPKGKPRSWRGTGRD